MTDGDFSKEAFEFALKKTYQEFIETLTPETKPKAFILGGTTRSRENRATENNVEVV
ncbi:MAG: hypothetical protein IK990_00330 [Ruminiclostridium sp.]|nr:hypothetical protein [Ruminiclostridium sp.]